MKRAILAVALAACSSNSGPVSGDGPNTMYDLSLGGSNDLAGAMQVAVTGTVVDNSGSGMGSTPISGATVSIQGTSTSTTSASGGTFTLMATAGTVIFVRASATNYQDLQQGLVVPAAGATMKFEMISLANVQQAVTALNPPLTVDPAKGDVLLQFNSTDNGPGYGGTISANHGMPFVPGKATAMYATTTTGQKSLVFPNVDVGTTTVTVSGPTGKTCALAQAIPNWRIDANVFTQIEVNCQ